MGWLLAGGVLAIIGVIAGLMIRSERRVARLLDRGSAVLEDHALVTLSGFAREQQLIDAPLSGTPCIGYVVCIRQFKTSYGMSNDERWTQSLEPFELEIDDDEGGTVLVDPGELVHLAFVVVEPARDHDRERQLLESIGADSSRLENAQFEEAVLLPGDRIRVHGVAIAHDFATDVASYREGERWYSIVGTPDHPLTIARS